MDTFTSTIRYTVNRHTPENVQRLAIGLVLGLFPLWLEAGQLFQPGIPYPVDGITNLLPPLHARYSLAHGQLPFYTELWFGGEWQFANPLWKGLYPPTWPLFIPGIPLIPALKVVLAAHYIATPAIAYWYAREDFALWIAAPFGLVFAMPMAMFDGMYEKVLAWPWVVLVVWQLTLPRIRDHPRRAGLLAGGGLGAILLAGDIYAFFYTSCLVGMVVVALRSKAIAFVCGGLLGGLVSVPKIILSIIPVLMAGADRPPVTLSVSYKQALASVAGFWIDISEATVLVRGPVSNPGYAVVGLLVLVVAAVTLVYVYLRPPNETDSRWLLGVSAAGVLGLLLASGWGFLYNPLVPVFSIFRITARALVIVALAALLIAWYGIQIATTTRRGHTASVVSVGVMFILVLSVINGAATWTIMTDERAIQTDSADRVAAAVQAAGCDSAWVGGADNVEGPENGDAIVFELTKCGISVTRLSYGRIGQTYATHKNGRLTFDVLIVGERLPDDGQVTFSGGGATPPPTVDWIDASQFYLLDIVETSNGPVYLYTIPGRCTT